MEQRIEFGLKSLRTENFRALCREYGISSKTGSKWRERFLGQGSEGMAEESGRPQKSSGESRGRGTVQDYPAQAGPPGLGAAQDPGIVDRRLQRLVVEWRPALRTSDGARRTQPLPVGAARINCAKSFERLFERHGLPQATRSDNGSPFASRQAGGRDFFSGGYPPEKKPKNNPKKT
jgi:Helix-turn-helix domain